MTYMGFQLAALFTQIKNRPVTIIAFLPGGRIFLELLAKRIDDLAGGIPLLNQRGEKRGEEAAHLAMGGGWHQICHEMIQIGLSSAFFLYYNKRKTVW